MIGATPASEEKNIMTRYYFHLWTRDEYVMDEIGVELAGADDAYLEAVHGAREITIELLRESRSPARYRFDVVDNCGRLIHSLMFSEALGQPLANISGAGFLAGASRGYKLAGDLAREIATARQNLQTCRDLIANSPKTRRVQVVPPGE